MIYLALPDEDAAAREHDMRIVDESGEDYLYLAEWFEVVDLPRRLRTSLLRRSTLLRSA
jgi:deoxycytidine triphosphate deaminase